LAPSSVKAWERAARRRGSRGCRLTRSNASTRGVARDLDDGNWDEGHGQLRELKSFDAGSRCG
jgi:hypothetical protein